MENRISLRSRPGVLSVSRLFTLLPHSNLLARIYVNCYKQNFQNKIHKTSTMRWLAMNRTALGESGVHVRNFSNTVQQKP